jgi:hypothetical protein
MEKLQKFLNESKKISQGKDITMNNLGEIPYSFIKMHWESTMHNRSYEHIAKRGQRDGINVDKSILQEFIEKVLIGENYTSLEQLQGMFDVYINTRKKKSGDIDKIVYNIKNNKHKAPNLEISNRWKYLMGKIGSTSASFVTISKSNDYNDVYSNPINGYEMREYKVSEPKPLSKLPTWNAIIFAGYNKFDDGDEYKVMPVNKIIDYLSREDDQNYTVYKI